MKETGGDAKEEEGDYYDELIRRGKKLHTNVVKDPISIKEEPVPKDEEEDEEYEDDFNEDDYEEEHVEDSSLEKPTSPSPSPPPAAALDINLKKTEVPSS